MGDIAEQLIEQEMFGYDEFEYKNHKPKYRGGFIERTPSEKKIASIRKEIAINVQNGMDIQEARKNANIKYGKGWRERGLVVNNENQWSEEELKEFK